MTTKEKIDQALGISCGKSMDEMLAELDVDEESVHRTLDGFDSTISAAVEKIDEKALELQRGVGDGALAIQDMTSSLKEIEGLIREAKEVFLHIKENIVSTDLIDAELIQGAAKFLEAMHVNIQEFISIYKQKSKFVEKIKLMIFQQQQKIDLMNLKHKHDLELIEAKKKEPETVDAQTGGVEFDTDAVVKSLQQSGSFDFARTRTAEFEDMNPPEDDEDEEDEDEDEDDEETVRKKR